MMNKNEYPEGFEEIKEEMDWDSEIEKDSPGFILLPTGDYDFEVVDFERSRHNGSNKLPPCPKATVHLKISGKDADGNEGSTTIKYNLFLHEKTEGMLCAFFTGIGQRKHGEKIKMNWGKVVGSTGRAKIGTRTYEGKEYNEVKKIYDPEENPPKIGTQTSFDPGVF